MFDLSGECNGKNIYDLSTLDQDDHFPKSSGFLPRGERSHSCRCCHKLGLKWGKYEGKWRLFEGDSLHVCPVNPLKEKEL